MPSSTGTPAHGEWNSLRTAEDSRYIYLAMPRVLAHLPYGAGTDPVEAFDFQEDVGTSGDDGYCWMSAAYVMAVNVARSFAAYGWCVRIHGFESGGAVANLPVHVPPTGATNIEMKGPTEVALDERREVELARLGLMPLLHMRNAGLVAFMGARSRS